MPLTPARVWAAMQGAAANMGAAQPAARTYGTTQDRTVGGPASNL